MRGDASIRLRMEQLLSRLADAGARVASCQRDAMPGHHVQPRPVREHGVDEGRGEADPPPRGNAPVRALCPQRGRGFDLTPGSG